MRYAALRYFVLAVAVCLFSGSLARADYIAQFNFTPDQTDIFATNNATLGKLTLSNESPTKINGGGLVATNITTSSLDGLTDKTAAIFKDAKFGLTLYITDFKTGKSDQMYFSGKFDGKLYTGFADIKETPTSPISVTKTIGAHIYTVTLDQFSRPGNSTSGKVGSISGLATITVSAVPEPSTFVLAGMAVISVGGGWWYRRRRTLALDLA